MSSADQLNAKLIQQTWKNFNLSNLQSELDETATELASRQEESENSRKKLVDFSRDFKKQSSEEVRRQVAPLLKSLQSEIDSLSRRSKAAEGAFLSIYKKLIEMPDPSPMLDAALQWQKRALKTHDMEIECQNLRETLAQYNSEFSEVKNQEVTIRQLREKIAVLEEQIEEAVQTQVGAIENSMTSYYEDREKQLQEAGNVLSMKCQEYERKASSLESQLSAVQSELFELRSGHEQRNDAKTSEIDLLLADFDRANLRAEAAERECDLLREQLQLAEQANSKQSQQSDMQISDEQRDAQRNVFEMELNAKDRQIAQLLEELQQLQSNVQRMEKSYNIKIESLKSEMEKNASSFAELEEKLKFRSDYEEICRELNALKSIEFGSSASNAAKTFSKPLEVLLLEKNKALQDTNTQTKMANEQMEAVSGAAADLSDASPPSNLSSIQTPECSKTCQQIVRTVGQLVARELIDNYEAASDRDLETELESLLVLSRRELSRFEKQQSRLRKKNRATMTRKLASIVAKNGKHVQPASATKSILPASAMPPQHPQQLFAIVTPPNDSNHQQALACVISLPISTVAAPPQIVNVVSSTSAFANGGPSQTSKTDNQPTCVVVDHKSIDPNCSILNQTPFLLPPPPLTAAPCRKTAALEKMLSDDRLPPGRNGASGFTVKLENSVDSAENLISENCSLVTDDSSRATVDEVVLRSLLKLINENLNNNSSESLDTVEVALRCKQLLNLYNIGQRLFAKCVLSQSQGALSELLSKPKPWNKLTEKGRESFRKIYAWISDEKAIELLRSLAPKRFGHAGKESSTRNNSTSSAAAANNPRLSESVSPVLLETPPIRAKTVEEEATEARVAAILVEAQQAQAQLQQKEIKMRAKQDNLVSSRRTSNFSFCNNKRLVKFKSLNRLSPALTSTLAANYSNSLKLQSMQRARSYRYRHDDIPKEMIFEIYQRELSKLKAQEHTLQQELSSSEQTEDAEAQNVCQDTNIFEQMSIERNNMAESTRNNCLTLIGVDRLNKSNADDLCRKRSTFKPIRPKLGVNLKEFGSRKTLDEQLPCLTIALAKGARVEKVLGFGSGKSVVSKTKIGATSPLSPCPSTGTRALKAILPPITQEQLDEYSYLNTELVVQKTKDFLSDNSISQRLFGEKVLGLSQGSVSDLLARPKQWHMLTQKGREPFIRMQIFLEDPDCLDRIASMRTPCRSISPKNLSSLMELEADEICNGDVKSTDNNTESNNSDLPFYVNSSDFFLNPKYDFSDIADENMEEAVSAAMPSSSSAVTANLSLSESVLTEFAAGLPDLDTQELVAKVRKELCNRRIRQRVFGETVMGLSESGVSEILSRPKPWDALSVKGREPYIKMHLWLQDSEIRQPIEEPKKEKARIETLEKQLHATRCQIEAKDELLLKLEEDLMKVHGENMISVPPQDPDNADGMFPLETANDAVPRHQSLSLSPPATSRSSDAMLSIVASQRERYRRRADEIEQQNVFCQQQIALLNAEVERINGDNVKLYEKIKFLQSYKLESKTASDVDFESCYQKQYEDSLDPFRKFHVQERQRKYLQLRTHDKATLEIGRYIMSNASARAVFFVYLLILHCLIFVVLYKLAHTEACKRDTEQECLQKFSEHMHQVHGQQV